MTTCRGCPTASIFTERLDSELARLQPEGDGLAVFFLDLDRFKEINDAHGHDAGDELICAVARRLSAALRGSDTLARFGGDEFAIIQTGVRTPNDCATLAHRLLDAMREPCDIDGRQIYVGLSIGIALAPQNARDRASLMKLADVALYRAKHEGRNRYAFFEIGMDSTMRLRKLVQEELRDAITGDAARDQLPAAVFRRWSQDYRRRGAGALAPPCPRHDLARRLHPHRGGARPHRHAGRVGAAPRLPRWAEVERHHRRRERVARSSSARRTSWRASPGSWPRKAWSPAASSWS